MFEMGCCLGLMIAIVVMIFIPWKCFGRRNIKVAELSASYNTKDAIKVGNFSVCMFPPIPKTKHINNIWIYNEETGEGMSADVDELWKKF